jgi:hypothetical protein
MGRISRCTGYGGYLMFFPKACTLSMALDQGLEAWKKHDFTVGTREIEMETGLILDCRNTFDGRQGQVLVDAAWCLPWL